MTDLEKNINHYMDISGFYQVNISNINVDIYGG